jgi:protein transport protein SEC13
MVHTRENDREQWRHKEVVKLPGPVWRVSWSVAGSLLAVSASDQVARLYKENQEGAWELTSQVNEKGALVGPEERSP